MRVVRKRGWQIDTDGVPYIDKDPDNNVYYEITIAMKGTALTAGPTWTSNGVGISDNSYSISGNDLILKLKVGNSGEATVKYADNMNNEEVQTVRFKNRDR